MNTKIFPFTFTLRAFVTFAMYSYNMIVHIRTNADLTQINGTLSVSETSTL